MVRFIIGRQCGVIKLMSCIYIPIWLDLLLGKPNLIEVVTSYLHSNMVRFIIITHSFFTLITSPFTFQYG